MKLQLCHLKVLLPLSLIINTGAVTALPEPNVERGLLGQVGDLVKNILNPLEGIIADLDAHPEISRSFPGLRNTLAKANNKDITAEDYVRGLLKCIQLHPEFKKGFEDLDPNLQQDVSRFMAGEEITRVIGKRSEFFLPPSPAVKEHFRRMEGSISGESHVVATSRRAWLNAKRQTSPVIYEDEKETKAMKVHINAPFHNWGLTVYNTPLYTFVPTTVHGLENLVKYAKSANKRIRASGYRHSWAPIFSADGEILVSMLDLATATAVPDPTILLPDQNHAGNEFKVIQLAENDVPGKEGKNRYVRVGAAVTNEELRRWAVRRDEWAMSVNTVIVEITQGGSIVPICHGGGIRHKTMSDLIRKIEYVDANGIHQSVTDPEQLKAAAGSFGLLGIVTHITFELDKMTYATMQPKKMPVNLAIPPPEGYKVPGPLKLASILTSPQKLKAAMNEFVDRATKDYYSEWFWFPYQKDAWVNCWNTTTDKTGVSGYPTPPDVFFQWIQGWLGGVMNDSALFRALPGFWQGVIMGTLGQLGQPPYGPIYQTIRTSLPDALHFRRGVQNMRLADLELEIPIPASASDPTKPDYSVVQKAWWDAIIEAYDDDKAPLRMVLEMRIMGGSDLIMAAQRGNTFGTASIEILTTMAAVDDGSWVPYAQRVMDKWMSLVDGNGARLKTRPHWAKEWDGMTVYGRPWREHLKTVSYKDEILEFKAMLGQIGEEQGWTLNEAQALFSNELWDEVIFS